MSPGESMTTSTFNYPSGTYGNGDKCFFAFKCTDPKKRLIMTFNTVFGVENSPNCTKDVVTIKDGLRLDSRVMGRFCGTTAPAGRFVSSVEKMMVNFKTDASGVAKGFEVTVTCPRKLESWNCELGIFDFEKIVSLFAETLPTDPTFKVRKYRDDFDRIYI